jgi:hypothetical protein
MSHVSQFAVMRSQNLLISDFTADQTDIINNGSLSYIKQS